MSNLNPENAPQLLAEVRFSLTTKLIIAFTVLMVSVVSFVIVAFPYQVRKEANRSVTEKLESIARLTASNISTAMFFDDQEYVQAMLQIVLLNEDIEYVLVLDTLNRIISGHNGASPYYVDFYLTNATTRISVDHKVVNMKTPLMEGNIHLGNLYIGLSLNALNDRLLSNQLFVYFLGMGVLVLGVAIVFFVSRHMTAPLQKMVRVVKDISHGNLSARVTVSTYDEAGVLGSAFNEMVENLEQNTHLLEAEIENRIVSERELGNSLVEKDVLLKEIHHRVKNNLQVISSLLYLQTQHTNNDETKTLLTESQTRVRSMALIHEKLYSGTNLAKIKLLEYIRNLTDDLSHTYRTTTENMKTTISGQEQELDIEAAIPCGLIINELFTNCLKYAFPEEASEQWQGRSRPIPEVRISLEQKEDALELCVRDNGVGMKTTFDLEKAETLGLKMVSILAIQLGGEVSIKANVGTETTLTFPVSQSAKVE